MGSNALGAYGLLDPGVQGVGSGDYGLRACKSSGHAELELKNCISGTCFCVGCAGGSGGASRDRAT